MAHTTRNAGSLAAAPRTTTHRTAGGAASGHALAVLPVLALILALCLGGCSEYSPARDVDSAQDADSASVFLFSDPPATAQVLMVEDGELAPLIAVETPRTLRLQSGDYVVHFSRSGHRDRLEGVLLGPGDLREISVTLDSIPEEPGGEPPSVVLEVTPEAIALGDPVTITVESDGDIGIILPIGIFTTNGTYTDRPARSGAFIYSFAAFRGGLWATAADTVIVEAPPEDPDQAQVLVFSNPRSRVEIFDIAQDGALIPTGQVLRTPFVVERRPGPVAFAFSEPGYAETMRALLLAPGEVTELNVDLAPVGASPPPPTIELSVEPREVEPGETVTYTIRSTNATYSILLGQEVVASTAAEWTSLSIPAHTRVTSAVAIGEGGVASDTTLVVVTAGPEEPQCTPIPLFPQGGVTTREPRVTLNSRGPIHVSPHIGPLRIRLLNQYSGNVPGQEDEAFAVGLRSGDRIIWALREGNPCPAVPDPAYEVDTTVWVECGAVDVPAGDYDVVMWHVSTGAFPCYEPQGDLSGPNSVNVQDAEVVVCRR